MGWNSSKFDLQFLMPIIFESYPTETELVGGPTNPKCFTVGENIKFWDAMNICSKMPLQSFCKSMNVKGKFDCPEIFEIKKIEDYFDENKNERRLRIAKYCAQDVEAMAEAVFVFNLKVIELLFRCRG